MAELIEYFIYANFGLLLSRYMFLSYFSSMHKFMELLVKKKNPYKDFKFSIIVPAYNEEITIGASIESMLKLNYSNYEVIVIDDGSSDRTYERALKYASNKVIVKKQENTGKPGALNTGIKLATGDIVITVDADSKLHPDSLIWLARRYSSDNRIAAVAGNVRITKGDSLLKIMQMIEYSVDINLARRSQSVLHSVMIMPGAIASIKRNVLFEIGLFPTDTYAEDFDVTMKVLEKHYRVEYEARAIAFTQAPNSLDDLLKQRRRWYRGTLQVLVKYQHMYFNPKYGATGMIGLPYLWLGMGSSVLTYLLIILSVMTMIYNPNVNFLTTPLIVYWVLMIVTSAYAISIDSVKTKEELLLIPISPFFNIFIETVKLFCIIEETLSIAMKWEKPKRDSL